MQHLIVIDKPAGMVVHPAPGNPDGTLVNALLAHCGAEPRRHRRGAPAGHRASARQGHERPAGRRQDRGWRTRRCRAISRRAGSSAPTAAFVWGVPRPPPGEIAGNIGRSPRQPQEDGRRRRKAAARPAVTRYRVERALRRSRGACRMPPADRPHPPDPGSSRASRPSADRRSGLRHARRARASRASAPAGAQIAAFPRQALHARLLGFTHPVDRRQLDFDSPLPADLGELDAKFRATLNWTKSDYISRVIGGVGGSPGSPGRLERSPITALQSEQQSSNGHPFGPFHLFGKET